MTSSVLYNTFRILQRFIRHNTFLRLPIQRLLYLWTCVTRYTAKLRTKYTSKSSEDTDVRSLPGAPVEEGKSQAKPIICASELPSSTLHPYSSSRPGPSVSSQDVTNTSFKSNYPIQNRSHPHISYPITSGRTALTASPAASISRLSITIPRANPTHLAVNDAASENSHVSIFAEDLTAEPATIVESPSQGYDITEVTTSPVRESGSVTLAEDRPGNKGLSEAYGSFYTVVPERTGRYYREDIIPTQETTYELAPMTTHFENARLPPGWKEFLHPEGARYFMYEHRRLYTDADLYNPRILEHVNKFINQFEEYIRTRSIHLSSQINVVFELYIDDDEILCQYYLADHATRTVFWLDKFTLDADTLPTWAEVKGVTEMSHIRHAIEAQYWFHCFLYPDCFSLRLPYVDELRDILIHSVADVVTSMTTTIPYEVTELQHMLKLTNNIRKNVESSKGVTAYSRLMNIFARQRFCNFHGLPAARLDRDRSVHQKSSYRPPRSLLIRILSPIMFSAPDTHCRALDKLWVDRFIHATSWNKFIANMNTEWQELILFGTVLLNANVAFLAIQSVDEDTASPNRSPAQIASYLSVVASIGSVIIGLMLARKNKVKSKEAADDAAIFLNSFMTERLGLETLAILYSVPYALLIVILFLAGFSFMCLFRSSITIRFLIVGAWLIVTLLVIWCIFTLASWDHRFNAEKTLWDSIIDAIISAALSTRDFGNKQLIRIGLKSKEEKPEVLRLRAPVRRMSEVLRRASRKATIFSAFSLLGSPSRQGSTALDRRRESTGETMVTNV
uniref:WW domain-containing protein n=1 Tax=Moniliophthora roreri TaxID=221103 RepID=A0A0W0GDU7_MONRR